MLSAENFTQSAKLLLVPGKWPKISHIMRTRLFKYTVQKISPPKIENFQIKNSDIFLISA